MMAENDDQSLFGDGLNEAIDGLLGPPSLPEDLPQIDTLGGDVLAPEPAPAVLGGGTGSQSTQVRSPHRSQPFLKSTAMTGIRCIPLAICRSQTSIDGK